METVLYVSTSKTVSTWGYAGYGLKVIHKIYIVDIYFGLRALYIVYNLLSVYLQIHSVSPLGHILGCVCVCVCVWMDVCGGVGMAGVAGVGHGWVSCQQDKL